MDCAATCPAVNSEMIRKMPSLGMKEDLEEKPSLLFPCSRQGQSEGKIWDVIVMDQHADMPSGQSYFTLAKPRLVPGPQQPPHDDLTKTTNAKRIATLYVPKQDKGAGAKRS